MSNEQQEIEAPASWLFYGEPDKLLAEVIEAKTSGTKIKPTLVAVGSQSSVTKLESGPRVLLTVQANVRGETGKDVEVYLTSQEASIIGMWLLETAKAIKPQETV